MSLNRYRLRHQARAGRRSARIAEHLLRRPDRLLGLILLGNNLVNLSASALTTLIALQLWGEPGVALATFVLLIVVLVFAEVAPKTYAAEHPERIALPSVFGYYPLLKGLYPFVWVVNAVANSLLWVVGMRHAKRGSDNLSPEELRTVVVDAGARIPTRYRKMLVAIFDLEKVTVEDVMVPRNEIVGIDLEDTWEEIATQLRNSGHTRLPVYRDGLDNIIGILHLRTVLNDLAEGHLDHDALERLARDAHFVPEGTPLSKQLVNFQRTRRRTGLIVDEYGDIQGLVTLDDILEEIVGEFTTDPATLSQDVHREGKNVYVVNGSANVRALNRMMNWHLPTDGPKTLNGLIVEQLETIPPPGTSLKLDDYPVEILQTSDTEVKTARIRAPLSELGAGHPS